MKSEQKRVKREQKMKIVNEKKSKKKANWLDSRLTYYIKFDIICLMGWLPICNKLIVS